MAGRHFRYDGGRGALTGEFCAFRMVELRKVIRNLAIDKATGPDGTPSEIYRNMPALVAPLQTLFTDIMTSGNLPQALRALYIAPSGKKGREPTLCRNKRPISPICIEANILEGLVRNRLPKLFESKLTECQYASLRERGTEFHLAELQEFIRKAREQGKYIYVAAIDVEAAFDSVPHDCVLQTLRDWGVGRHTMRYLRKWPEGRRFAIRLRSPTGVHYSSYSKLTRGLSQGEIISPPLWLSHFNSKKEQLDACRAKRRSADLPEKTE